MEVRGDLTSVCGFNLLTYIVIVLIVGYVTSTLHCRGKNGRSKKIGQTNQKMIHFVPNMYVSGTISALRPGTQTGMIFGIWNSKKKPKTTLNNEISGFAGFCVFSRFFLWVFCEFFCGVLRVFSLVVWCAANIFWPCLTKPKIMQSKS